MRKYNKYKVGCVYKLKKDDIAPSPYKKGMKFEINKICKDGIILKDDIAPFYIKLHKKDVNILIHISEKIKDVV